MFKKITFLFAFSFFCLIVFSPTMKATEKKNNDSSDLKEIESVLDQLENDVPNNSSKSDTKATKKTSSKSSSKTTAKKTSSKYKFSKSPSSPISSTIYGKVEKKSDEKPVSKKSLDTLENSIALLEKDVESLASDVQKTKQTLLENSSIDNFVTISVVFEHPQKASITDLDIKLDGFPLYYLKESSGLWLPGDMLSLYSGPLKPGTHRLSLEARMAQKYDQDLMLNNDSYHFINDNFALTVPAKGSDLRYKVVITPPSNSKEKASASLKEETPNEKKP